MKPKNIIFAGHRLKSRHQSQNKAIDPNKLRGVNNSKQNLFLPCAPFSFLYLRR